MTKQVQGPKKASLGAALWPPLVYSNKNIMKGREIIDSYLDLIRHKTTLSLCKARDFVITTRP